MKENLLIYSKQIGFIREWFVLYSKFKLKAIMVVLAGFKIQKKENHLENEQKQKCQRIREINRIYQSKLNKNGIGML